jgi:cytoskeletal protein CcmA (bactofilin family)
MIGKTIQVKGTITGSENLVIEGTVDGTVDLPQNDLTVGESGQVTADLVAKVVKVDGQVTGDISGNEKVVISKSGKVKGNIVAPRVTLEDGAKFKGSIDMDPGENVPAAVESPASVGKAASNIDAKSSR